MRIAAYLTFNGNCRDAMTFYRACFGGDLTLQTVGESPASKKLPAKMRRAILHASLSNRMMTLYGTDLVPDEGFYRGNSLSLTLLCKSRREVAVLYRALSRGATEEHPVSITHWKTHFGALTDKFGVHWLLATSK